MKKALSLMMSAVLFFSFTGCAKDNKKRFEAEFLNLFDTATKIIGRASSREEFTEFSQYIHDELKVYHELYDIYNNYEGINNLKAINDNAGKTPLKVDAKIIALLEFSKKLNLETDNKMNIALGSVLKIWHRYREEGTENPEDAAIPSRAELEAAAIHTNINDLIINKEDATVFLKDSEMSLDVGSVGKGYAVGKVYEAAIKKGYTDFVLSVGGNVITHGSRDEKGTPWNIAIQNPDSAAKNVSLYNVNLSGYALVTSGNYQRYYTVDGKRYHHIIDKDTWMPADYYAAVSVLSPDSGLADCLSTALYCMPLEAGRQLLKNYENAEAVWVYNNGNVAFSDNFESFIKK